MVLNITYKLSLYYSE
uniref:Uncharacterized protein n=1 Tax=Anguilla anguilla TaxID=7936 RepID=A0A0E9UBG5_ANGAN